MTPVIGLRSVFVWLSVVRW